MAKIDKQIPAVESIIRSASWPRDAPNRHEEKIISIVCGNTHLHWAVHEGQLHDFVPILFWRTPPMVRAEQEDDPTVTLGRHLPLQAQAHIFGSTDAPQSKAVAAQAAALRRIPALSVYVMSTNPEHEATIPFLFKDVPHRMYKLNAEDFFTKEQGVYEGMGVDRVATLKGAIVQHRYPCLVLDGGTALTYTAMDQKGLIMGGGILPGLAMRFRALHDSCGRLPYITHEDLKPLINDGKEKVDGNVTNEDAAEKQEPMPTFAMDTRTQIMSSSFSEVACGLRNVVKQWLVQVKEEPQPVSEEEKEGEEKKEGKQPSTKPVVVFTGGDGALLHKLMKKDHDFVVTPEPNATVPHGDFEMHYFKHLIHNGVAACLTEKYKESTSLSKSPEDELRLAVTGQRLAKNFEVADYNGDFVYRGTVVRVLPGVTFEDDLFDIRYDDGDNETLELKELFDGFKLYEKVGEKEIIRNKVQKERLVSKMTDALRAADSILAKSDMLKEHVKKVANAAKPKPPARSSANISTIVLPTSPNVDKLSFSADQATNGAHAATTTSAKRGRLPKSPDDPPASGKKAKTVSKRSKYLGERVAKVFEQEDETGQPFRQLYFGNIDRYVATADESNPLWHVQYDDDDEEEFDEKDVTSAIKLYAKEKKNDPQYIKEKKNEPKVAKVAAFSPASITEAPAGKGEAPAGNGEAPAGKGEVPAGKGEVPAGKA